MNPDQNNNPPVAPQPPVPPVQPLEEIPQTQVPAPQSPPGLQVTSASPQVNQANKNWQDSKLVKFGGAFLYLFWAIFIIAVFKGIGLLGLVVITAVLFTAYKKYEKTKSPTAKRILQIVGGIVAISMAAIIYG